MRTLGIAGLILLNVVFNVIANVGFKWSALSARLKEFLTWQVVGNVSGFLAVLTLTFVMRFIPLSQALAFSWGLGFVAWTVSCARRVGCTNSHRIRIACCVWPWATADERWCWPMARASPIGSA